MPGWDEAGKRRGTGEEDLFRLREAQIIGSARTAPHPCERTCKGMVDLGQARHVRAVVSRTCGA